MNKPRKRGGQITHGMTDSREYNVWCAMKQRCYNNRTREFNRYGGRGILVCGKWLHSFADFFQDMGPCPAGMTLERINRDGNYEPSNCIWATWEEQRSNTCRNRYFTINGQRKILARWADSFGLDPEMVRKRLKRGLSIEEALTTPPRYST